MSVTQYPKPDLDNRRDSSIIMFVFRNFIARHLPVHELFFADDVSLDMSGKVLRRLTKDRWLTKHRLFGNELYFRLGPAAVARWGYPRSRTRALGRQRLPYEIGTLAYMCLDEQPRKRLLGYELQQLLPWMPNQYTHWAYFWEVDRLGTVRVEISGWPRRIVTKLSDQLFEYAKHRDFRDFIESGQFFITVVCATEEQELGIQEEAARRRFPVELRTASHQDLIHFI